MELIIGGVVVLALAGVAYLVIREKRRQEKLEQQAKAKRKVTTNSNHAKDKDLQKAIAEGGIESRKISRNAGYSEAYGSKSRNRHDDSLYLHSGHAGLVDDDFLEVDPSIFRNDEPTEEVRFEAPEVVEEIVQPTVEEPVREGTSSWFSDTSPSTSDSSDTWSSSSSDSSSSSSWSDSSSSSSWSSSSSSSWSDSSSSSSSSSFSDF